MANIITICGSRKTDFEEYMKVYKRLTLEWNLVFLPAFLEKNQMDYKDLLKLQFEKIKISDYIYVMDYPFHIGDGVMSEIAFAEVSGKKILQYSQDKYFQSSQGDHFIYD